MRRLPIPLPRAHGSTRSRRSCATVSSFLTQNRRLNTFEEFEKTEQMVAEGEPRSCGCELHDLCAPLKLATSTDSTEERSSGGPQLDPDDGVDVVQDPD
jgi:hypothetical protein